MCRRPGLEHTDGKRTDGPPRNLRPPGTVAVRVTEAVTTTMADLSQHHAAGVRSFAFAEARDAAFAAASRELRFCLDAEGRLTHVEGPWQSLLGREPIALLGAHWRVAVSPLDHAAMRVAIEHVLSARAAGRARSAHGRRHGRRLRRALVAAGGRRRGPHHGRRLRAGSRPRRRAGGIRAAASAGPRARVQGRRPERAQPLDGGLRGHRRAPALRAADRRRERHDHGRRGPRRRPRPRAAGPAGRDRPRRRARPPDGRRAAPRCPLGQRAQAQAGRRGRRSPRRCSRTWRRRCTSAAPSPRWPSSRSCTPSRGCCPSSSTT